MADTHPDRESYFPAIEKKHGLPMSYWFDQMKEIGDKKYLEQIAYLRENHGFSQAHANALVRALLRCAIAGRAGLMINGSGHQIATRSSSNAVASRSAGTVSTLSS